MVGIQNGYSLLMSQQVLECAPMLRRSLVHDLRSLNRGAHCRTGSIVRSSKPSGFPKRSRFRAFEEFLQAFGSYRMLLFQPGQ